MRKRIEMEVPQGYLIMLTIFDSFEVLNYNVRSMITCETTGLLSNGPRFDFLTSGSGLSYSSDCALPAALETTIFQPIKYPRMKTEADKKLLVVWK